MPSNVTLLVIDKHPPFSDPTRPGPVCTYVASTVLCLQALGGNEDPVVQGMGEASRTHLTPVTWFMITQISSHHSLPPKFSKTVSP